MTCPDVARETPPAELLHALTPNASFFVRSHAAGVPHADHGTFRLEIGGPSGTRAFSLDELHALPRASETITLACAGNGRTAFSPQPEGLPWGFGAVATARWGGVRVRDLLRARGVLEDGARHAVLEAGDAAPDADRPPYRRSIPLERALADGTLVADTMNGEPLPPEHGGPVRLVVGGWSANHSVKWLRRITLAAQPDAGYWMTADYRIPAPDGSMRVIEATAPIAIIASPSDGEPAAGELTVRGIAYGEPAPARVAVEVDGRYAGDAAVRYDDGRYACGRWSVPLRLASGAHRLAARPADARGAVYPPTPWNARGYCYGGPHTIEVNRPHGVSPSRSV